MTECGMLPAAAQIEPCNSLSLLSEAELDVVAAGHGGYMSAGHGGNGMGSRSLTVIEIVNITIGKIVASSSGNSTVTVDVIGIGGNTSTIALGGRGHHR